MKKNKKNIYNLCEHPKVAHEKKKILDPYQKGLLVERKSSKAKENAGKKFENEISSLLLKEFKDCKLLSNIYFESGNYIEKFRLYETIQIDHILITNKGIYCIEDKYIDDNKCIRLSGGALAKCWSVKYEDKNRVKVRTEVNGLKQNYGHLCFLQELFEVEHLGNIPIFQITVLGGINRSKIGVQQFMDANLVDENELVHKIKYIENRTPEGNWDINKINDILVDWQCKREGIEKLHIVYLRSKERKRLPKRCKMYTI